MKLTRIEKPLHSVQVRVTLAGDLNVALESYARYYEHVHGDLWIRRRSSRKFSAPFFKPTVSSSVVTSGDSSHGARPDMSSTNGRLKAQA